MNARGKTSIGTALSDVDAALVTIQRRVRRSDPVAARALGAAREVLDHVCCLARLGEHTDCGCPRDLARYELAIATCEFQTVLAAFPNSDAGIHPVVFCDRPWYTTKGVSS